MGFLAHSDFPRQVVAELTAACNQKCIFCGRNYMQRVKKTMPHEIFLKIAREIATESPYTEFWPTFMGEALLLKGTAFTLIKQAKEIGCRKITLNTNGSLLDDRLVEMIIDSQLDRFIVSMDALTEATHTKVRPAVNPGKNAEFFCRMREGTERLLETVRERNLAKPLVEVQFSVFDENEHERDAFRAYWLQKGAVVKERPKLLWSGQVPFNASEAFFKGKAEGGIGDMNRSSERIPCKWSLETCGIYWDGTFAVCVVDCAGVGAAYVKANVQNATIKEVWNGRLKELRKIHLEKRFAELPQPCRDCPDWQTKRSVAYFPSVAIKQNYEAYINLGLTTTDY